MQLQLLPEEENERDESKNDKLEVHVYEYTSHTGQTLYSAMINGGWWVATNPNRRKAVKAVVERYKKETQELF